MSSFTFDESKSIDDNLAAFFTHLEDYDAEFAAHLAATLNDEAIASFDRSNFNKATAAVLDTLPTSTESQP